MPREGLHYAFTPQDPTNPAQRHGNTNRLDHRHFRLLRPRHVDALRLVSEVQT